MASKHPVRYRIKKSDEGSDYHYVVVGANGEIQSTSEPYDTPSKAEDRVARAWLNHVHAIRGETASELPRSERAALLILFPIPWASDSIRARRLHS